MVETMAPVAGAVTLTAGGAVSTVTLTAAEVVVWPAVPRAIAVKALLHVLAVAGFHAIEYGAAVSSAARLAPSRRNCTPATPTLSDALAVTVVTAETMAPVAGAVTVIAGGAV